MLFSEQFIESLKNDPVAGTVALCDTTFQALAPEGQEGWRDEDFAILIEGYALLVEVIEAGLLPMTIAYPSIVSSGRDECPRLYLFLTEVRETCASEEVKLRVAALRQKFRVSLGLGFMYEFSQGDLDRVRSLLSQLREMIAVATQFEMAHQQRLLRRLDRIHSELHKKVSDLDRFWGLVGDAGVVATKLGNDAKPMVDMIREIADIVWQTQSRAEELPSGTSLPQLASRPVVAVQEV